MLGAAESPVCHDPITHGSGASALKTKYSSCMFAMNGIQFILQLQIQIILKKQSNMELFSHK